MNIGIERRHIGNMLYMLLLVQNTLIDMGNCPAKRDVELEKLCQLIRGLLGV